MKMKMTQIVTLGCFILLSVAGTAFSQSRIGSFPIPRMVESAEKGVFVELAREIINRTGENVEIVIYPTKRTVGMFHDKEIIGFFPALEVMIRQDYSRSGSINQKNDIAVVRQGDKILSSIKELKGKKLGLTLGYPYSPEILNDKDIQIDYTQSDVTNLKKLAMGRLDVVIIAESSLQETIKQADVTNIDYDLKKPIYIHDVFYAFQSSPEGKKLADLFSKAMESMKKDGTFQRILSQ